jgi:hypothetical protein
VPRDRQGVQFGFDAENKLGVAAIAFAYDRKEELRGTLISLWGAPKQVHDPRNPNAVIYLWPSDNGIRARLDELGEGAKTIVWLAVFAPGYKYAQCPSARR